MEFINNSAFHPFAGECRKFAPPKSGHRPDGPTERSEGCERGKSEERRFDEVLPII